MTILVKELQEQGILSNLITLYELELDPNITTDSYAYFYAGLEGDSTTIKFRKATSDSSGIYQIAEYVDIPIKVLGFEVKTDSPSPRPTLQIANLLSTLSDALDGLSNDDMLGKKLIRRRTLYKYCVGQSGDDATGYTAPIEFPRDIWFIDRIAVESPGFITFELASPYDIQGVQLPRRMIIGNACPFQYQGADPTTPISERSGGCTWNKFSRITIPTTGVTYTNYINKNNQPVIPKSVGDAGATYSSGSITQNIIYKTAKTGLVVVNPDKSLTTNDDTTNPVYDYWQATESISDPGTPSDANKYFRRVRVYQEWNLGEKWAHAYTDSDYNDYMTYKQGAVNTDKRTDEDYSRLWQVKTQTQEAFYNKPISLGGFPQFGAYWQRGDICGKSIESCMQRYQYATNAQNVAPNIIRRETEILQFGGFPSAKKGGR
jgi:lambda family phage minor tail protein L|tara:strand:- start:4558 stop:5856 length:1299 start_codon:yes stop_codon:yes gene_type:complete